MPLGFSSKKSNSLLSLDAAPLRRAELVKFALRVHKGCFTVFIDVSLHHLSLFSLPSSNLPVLLDENFNFHNKSTDKNISFLSLGNIKNTRGSLTKSNLACTDFCSHNNRLTVMAAA